jgi:hypothetical protein
MNDGVERSSVTARNRAFTVMIPTRVRVECSNSFWVTKVIERERNDF